MPAFLAATSAGLIGPDYGSGDDLKSHVDEAMIGPGCPAYGSGNEHVATACGRLELDFDKCKDLPPHPIHR